jgi:hypothetical protein
MLPLAHAGGFSVVFAVGAIGWGRMLSRLTPGASLYAAKCAK